MPVATMGLILANVAVFLYQLDLPQDRETVFIYTYALVPAVIANPELARHVGLDPYNYWPLITNTFMHGGFLHLIFNMWTLWLFGLPVEGRLNSWRFLLFYLACGTLGSLGHLAFNLDSTAPALGASGAIAGLLGGYTRLFPRAKVTLVFPIIIIPVIFSVPALVYTGVWFALQVWQGTGELQFGSPAGGGIAWWAHIGGFLAGLVLVGAFHRPTGRPGPPLPSGISLRRGPWSHETTRRRKGPWG
jgi:membrane associated rhomboid family serine protease